MNSDRYKLRSKLDRFTVNTKNNLPQAVANGKHEDTKFNFDAQFSKKVGSILGKSVSLTAEVDTERKTLDASLLTSNNQTYNLKVSIYLKIFN
jgi:hypothetical protein